MVFSGWGWGEVLPSPFTLLYGRGESTFHLLLSFAAKAELLANPLHKAIESAHLAQASIASEGSGLAGLVAREVGEEEEHCLALSFVGSHSLHLYYTLDSELCQPDSEKKERKSKSVCTLFLSLSSHVYEREG